MKILLLTLFSICLFAQESSVEDYCFSTPTKAREVAARLKAILLPVDQLSLNADCFTIVTVPHRRELLQNYTRRLDPDVAVSFSSAAISTEPCDLKVEKIKNKNNSQTSVNMNSQVNIAETKSNLASSETMHIKTINNFELTYKQFMIDGVCKRISPDRYEITLQVRKDPKPLLPPVPQGTIVVVQPNQLPPPQETSALKTTIQINRGDRIELGSILKKNDEKDQSVNINPSIHAQIQNNQETENIYLSLK